MPWRGCSMNIFLQRARGLHNNIARPSLVVVSLAIVDSMMEVLVGVVFTPVCSLVLKIIVSTKRKIQQETRGRSYGQQNPCEKECHQPKLSVIVQNEKMRDSTICEEESHKIMCERDTQKLSEKEDESCEELFTTNMIIPSSSLVPCVMQAHVENDVVNYEQPPIFDEEDQVMAMDSDTYAYVASQDVEVIVHQNLCENESHRAKLRESEDKRELCDSIHYDVESINNSSVRDTPQRNRELECKSCEDMFETNTHLYF